MDTALRTKRGFLSSTTNTFQFGILEKNQWAGEERLIKEIDEPSGYSIIAKTKVRAFSISKEDAKKKFTKEIMEFIVNLVKQRYIWIKERAKSLTQASVNVAKMDPSDIKYDDNLAELTKKFPTATSYVLTNIRKKSIIAKSYSGTKIIQQNTLNTARTEQLVLGLGKASSSLISPMATQTFHNLAGSTNNSQFMSMTSRGPFQPAHEVTLPSVFPTIRTLSVCDTQRPNNSSTLLKNHKGPPTMCLAASTSKLVRAATFAPVYQSKSVIRNRTESLSLNRQLISRRGKSKDEVKLNTDFKIEMDKKNLNKFIIGKRTIKITDIYGQRPVTPNPFAIIPAKSIIQA